MLVAPGEASVRRRALRRAAAGHAAAGGAAQNRGGEGVLRARAGRRGVHHRRRRGRAAPGWRPELAELNTLRAAHGDEAFLAALARAVAFGRWRAADVRSILAAGAGAPSPRPAGTRSCSTCPPVPTRPLADYAIGRTARAGR